MRAFAIVLALTLAATTSAKEGGGGRGKHGDTSSGFASPPSAGISAGSGGTGGAAVRGGSSRYGLLDPRKVPELDPNRRINLQDCTKPVDLLAGNLRCK